MEHNRTYNVQSASGRADHNHIVTKTLFGAVTTVDLIKMPVRMVEGGRGKGTEIKHDEIFERRYRETPRFLAEKALASISATLRVARTLNLTPSRRERL